MATEPAEAAARVDRAIDALNVSIRDIRNFIFGLRPELVEQGGLVAGLATLVNEFRLNTLIDAELEADDLPSGEPAPRCAPSCSRSPARRSATSPATRGRARSRSGSSRRRRRARARPCATTGAGFDPTDAHPDGHPGSRTWRARAADLGGRLEVASEPGAGTDIIVRVPLARIAAARSPDGRPGGRTT